MPTGCPPSSTSTALHRSSLSTTSDTVYFSPAYVGTLNHGSPFFVGFPGQPSHDPFPQPTRPNIDMFYFQPANVANYATIVIP